MIEILQEENGGNDLVGKPIVHASAYKHVTGEAHYCDDASTFENELAMCLVLSERAHAKIISVDISAALELEGVVGYISSQDLEPERNKFGLIINDEEIFASSEVRNLPI